MFDKTWFYIEDEAHGDKSIDCTRCRLLCELKNGKSFSCEIEELPLKLFAVSGDFDGINSVHGYALDICQIEASCDDVKVTGKRKLNPAKANCFEFDK